MENKITVPDRRDMFLAAGMVLCGFLFWEGALMICGSSLGKAVFTLLICTVSGAYLYANGFRQSRESLTVLAVMAILAATFVLFSGRTEHAVTLPVLAAMYLYWVALTCRETMDDKLSAFVLGDLLKQSCVIPFINYETCPKVIAKNSKGKGGSSLLMVAIGIVIAVPLALAAISLLSQADRIFGDMIRGLLDSLSWNWIEYVIELIIGIPVAFYIFGQVYGNAKGDRLESLNKKEMSDFMRTIAKVPPLIGSTVLTCLNIIYIVFLGVQTGHLVQGLPEGMTYAAFARQGFFQLCEVSVLNLAVILVAGLLCRRKGNAGRYIRIQTGLMCVLTTGITCTALAKMFMYIDVFGLTPKRIYTSIFMVFLITVFLSAGIYQFRRFNIGKVICISGIVLLILFNYAGVDRTVAGYNIYRYENGTLGMMDRNLMYSLGDGAAPELYRLWTKTADSSIEEVLSESPCADSWAYWSLERERANRARRAFRSAQSTTRHLG